MIYDLLVVGGGSGGVRAARITLVYWAQKWQLLRTRTGAALALMSAVYPKKMYHYVGSA